MTSAKPKHNRCDACGRNAHKVAVREPIKKLNGTAIAPTGEYEVNGYCPSCMDRRYEALIAADPLRTVIYDRRAK